MAYIRRWYKQWRNIEPSVDAAAADDTNPQTYDVTQSIAARGSQSTIVKLKDRRRSIGGGRKVRAPLVRKALYEWWAGIRYAISWESHIGDRRSRGRKCLARFPRSVMRAKP